MPISDPRVRTVVLDASPLIFLAKIARLDLIEKVVPGERVVMQCVVSEILSERATPGEIDHLRAWLEGMRVVDFESRQFKSSALSRCDQCTLAWAVKAGASWIIADERLLRRVARQRGIGVLGFCGILVKAAQRSIISTDEARKLLNEAIDSHGLRISIPVYRQILESL